MRGHDRLLRDDSIQPLRRSPDGARATIGKHREPRLTADNRSGRAALTFPAQARPDVASARSWQSPPVDARARSCWFRDKNNRMSVYAHLNAPEGTAHNQMMCFVVMTLLIRKYKIRAHSQQRCMPRQLLLPGGCLGCVPLHCSPLSSARMPIGAE